MVPPILISLGWARASGVGTRETTRTALTRSVKSTPIFRSFIRMSALLSWARLGRRGPSPATSCGWQDCVGSDSQIGLPDAVGARELRARPAHDDLAGLEHVGAVADLQRLHDVLLDEEDAHALLVERPEDAEQFPAHAGRE